MSRSYDIHVGNEVTWRWGGGTGSGSVTERFTETVTRTIKGNEVTRKATPDDPAYLIEQDDGDLVLKAASELEHAD